MKDLNFSISNLEISFVSSENIIALNKKYLNHIGSTDVITFAYSKSNSILEGEIIISSEDANKSAKRFRTTQKKEILRLLIHGILHLIGYNDIKLSERKIMKTKEDLLVNKYASII
ncbi:MAG: rRNA maturation RNase YbeY [Ignavibacteriaceae bacterium]|nr:rRNA maturation RNase YbeY [Ignavibacteriaceae bacterium]